MSEIRIKSGNLFDGELEQGGISKSGSDASSAVRVRGYANVKPLTAYTIAANKPFRMCYGYNYDSINLKNVGLIFDNNSGNNKLSAFTTPEGCNYIRFALWNGDESNIIPTEVQNLNLVEGTYTSKTIPEYQPYFLNRPAHKFINGEWIDIPTHHYTNGRWQGELTSQSPLKFRADGDMLDWRVEGRTSGNLFDGELEQGSLGTSAGQEYPTTTRVRTKKPGIDLQPGTYTIDCVGATGGVVVYVYNKDSSWDKEQSSKNWQSLPLTLSLSSERLVRFAFRKTGDSDILPSEITDIQLLEGAYTADTLPPYEPYGGVGDWDETEPKYRIPVTVNGVTTTLYTDHQLMDGDSIDYATDQTAIPIATGNNILTVDTAVQPKSVFVKFEG